MSAEFSELERRLKELTKWHVRAVATFAAFETILKLRAPNLVGEAEAKGNAEAIGRYKGLFNTAEKACNYELLMTLARIFVAHKDALYIERLVNFAEQNQKRLTVEDFKEFHEGREYLDELIAIYQGLNKNDLAEINQGLQNAQDSIGRLKELRDQTLAHINLAPPDDVSLTYQELADLIELSEKIINTLSARYFQSGSYFKLYEEQVIDDTTALVRLARLENDQSELIEELLEGR